MGKNTVRPGDSNSLGAVYDGEGVNFSLFSEYAQGVELCLFNRNGTETRVAVTDCTHNIWHIYLPEIQPGQLYGYRIHGPYEPENGHRFNPNKLLLDPYARAIEGAIQWNDALYGYDVHSPDKDLSFSHANSAPFMPKSVVVDETFNWHGDQLLHIPLEKTIIYELHVKGFTRLSPVVPENDRGKYSGLACVPSVSYLKSLGINTVELMPVHHFINERHLIDKGLTNYWGYSTIGYFCPDSRYSACCRIGDQVTGFKEMVRALHDAGIEVILDVVYNHTGEGNQLGPTLCFRGLDNHSYYRLKEKSKRYYQDYTGTGNTLNTVHPAVLRMVTDSLRYWAQKMHVDGFRFDLATVLARESDHVIKWGSFFDTLRKDPVLSRVKLIAEPWDIGENGYQVGKFPAGWLEWNPRYRDTLRQFWNDGDIKMKEFAHRFTGSSDLYRGNRRALTPSINFVTAHDGFTMMDMVSYNVKHNRANGENNLDGENHNHSFNYGVEGSTSENSVNGIRKQQIRNFLTTMFLSRGIPMLVAGDEQGRTQMGNNNAYCQDNEHFWLNWTKSDPELVEFTSKLIHFRLAHPVFCNRKWFQFQHTQQKEDGGISWFMPDGLPVSDEQWNSAIAKSYAVVLSGVATDRDPDNNEKMVDDTFLLMVNTAQNSKFFTLPGKVWNGTWYKILDTTDGLLEPGNRAYPLPHRGGVKVEGRSIILYILECAIP
jgi:isoamylase